MSARAAGDYGLVFVDAPPPPRRAIGEPRADRPPTLRVLSDYVAPDSRRAHGSYVKYVVEKCRCPDCRAAHRTYNQRRIHAISRPDETWVPYVPAGPARRHCRELMAAGVGLKQIAKVSRLPHGGLSRLIYGQSGRPPSKRIRQHTAERILAVTKSDLAGGAKVPAGPTWRLVDELLAAGYWKAWIARQIGQQGSGLQLRRSEVSARNARAVAALHAAHIHKPPPKRPSRWDRR